MKGKRPRNQKFLARGRVALFCCWGGRPQRSRARRAPAPSRCNACLLLLIIRILAIRICFGFRASSFGFGLLPRCSTALGHHGSHHLHAIEMNAAFLPLQDLLHHLCAAGTDSIPAHHLAHHVCERRPFTELLKILCGTFMFLSHFRFLLSLRGIMLPDLFFLLVRRKRHGKGYTISSWR